MPVQLAKYRNWQARCARSDATLRRSKVQSHWECENFARFRIEPQRNRGQQRITRTRRRTRRVHINDWGFTVAWGLARRPRKWTQGKASEFQNRFLKIYLCLAMLLVTTVWDDTAVHGDYLRQIWRVYTFAALWGRSEPDYAPARIFEFAHWWLN